MTVRNRFWRNQALPLAMLVLVSLQTALAAERQVAANGFLIRIDPASDDLSDLTPMLEGLQRARIAHLIGDLDSDNDLLYTVRLRLIRFLFEQADYDVLVLPIGIVEGWWLDRKLTDGASAADASTTVYRVWRESDSLLRILEYSRHSRSGGRRLEITGGLCRFHANAKELYSPHLTQFFQSAGVELPTGLTARIQESWAGRARLTDMSPRGRQLAGDLADTVLARAAGSISRHSRDNLWPAALRSREPVCREHESLRGA